MADRLNYIANYTIRVGLIIPITGSKYADDLRTMEELLIEVMKKMFYQEGVLDHEDLLDMEDFALFQETVSRTMQLQAISAIKCVTSFSRFFTTTNAHIRTNHWIF